jgi:SecD/SecF fusion protein
MQNLKGVIKFFTTILLLACLFQLSFTFMADRVESKADKYAAGLVKVTQPAGLSPAQVVAFRDSVDYATKVVKRNYLDSIAGVPLINVWGLKDIYTYKFCRDHALTLGLDLKGGMSLIMEIAQDDVLRKLSNNNPNHQFDDAIKSAVKLQATTQGDFLTLFKQEFEKANPSGKLSSIFGQVESYQGKISATSSNDEVINLLRKDFDAAIHETSRY